MAAMPPASPACPSPPLSHEGTLKVLQGKRFFLVEDDVLLLMSLQEIVQGWGCHVLAIAMTLEQACSLAAEHPYDFAVLDVNLQGEMVTPVAEMLAEREIPFVFTTGYGEPILPAFADRPIVPKPYRADDLLAALSHVAKGGSA